MTVLLSLFVVLVAIAYTNAAGNCPLPSKVYGCSPKCVQDYECSHGKVCCSNACNAKSCSEPAAYGGAGGHGGSHQSQSGTGIYCDNVKCSPGQVCKMDPSTKRNKCSRP